MLCLIELDEDDRRSDVDRVPDFRRPERREGRFFSVERVVPLDRPEESLDERVLTLVVRELRFDERASFLDREPDVRRLSAVRLRPDSLRRLERVWLEDEVFFAADVLFFVADVLFGEDRGDLFFGAS